MASTDWPFGETLTWLLEGYGYGPADVERRMETPAGYRVRRIGTTGPDKFSGQLILSAPQFAYWVGWIRHAVESGMLWLTVPAMAAGLSVTLSVRLPISSLSYERLPAGDWRVSANWETAAGTEMSEAEYLALELPETEWPFTALWQAAGYSYAPMDLIDRYETSTGSAQWPVSGAGPDRFGAGLLLDGTTFGQFVAWLRYGLRGRWFQCVIAANGTVETRTIRFIGGSMQYRLIGPDWWTVATNFESRMSTELQAVSFDVVDSFASGTTTPYSDFARALSDSVNEEAA